MACWALRALESSARGGVSPIRACVAANTARRALILTLKTPGALRFALVGLEGSWLAFLAAPFGGSRKTPGLARHARRNISAFVVFGYGTFCAAFAGPACLEVASEPVLETSLQEKFIAGGCEGYNTSLGNKCDGDTLTDLTSGDDQHTNRTPAHA